MFVLGTHHEKGAQTFWSVVNRLPLSSNAVLCWKFCHVFHKLLRDGHPNVSYWGAGYGQRARDPNGESVIAWATKATVYSCTEDGNYPLLLTFCLLIRDGFVSLWLASLPCLKPNFYHPLSPFFFSNKLFSSLSRS